MHPCQDYRSDEPNNVTDVEHLIASMSKDTHQQDNHGHAGADAFEVLWFEKETPVALATKVCRVEDDVQKQ